MLVIRLSRTGRSKVPTYRIVVAEKTSAVKGHYQEILGNFQPAAKPAQLTYEKDRILYWVSKGAQPSDTVARILSKDGVTEMAKFYDPAKKYSIRNKKAPVEKPAEAVKAEAPATDAPATEAPKVDEAPVPPAEAPKADEAPVPPAEAPKADEAPAPAAPAEAEEPKS